MVTYMHPTAPLSSFNAALSSQLRSRGSPKRDLENVLKIVEEIKRQNLRLDLNSYNALLTAYCRAKDTRSVMSTFDEMKKDNIEPTQDTFNILLEVRTKQFLNFRTKIN